MAEKRVKNKEVKIRLSDELHLKLKETAKKNKRSIIGQVEWYIERCLETEQALYVKDDIIGGRADQETSAQDTPFSSSG